MVLFAQEIHLSLLSLSLRLLSLSQIWTRQSASDSLMDNSAACSSPWRRQDTSSEAFPSHLSDISSGSASSEGPGLCGRWRRVLQRDPAVVKCDGLVFGAFPGCVTRCFTLMSRFLAPRPAKVTICRHFLAFFLLFRACNESWDMWRCEGSQRCILQKKGEEGAFVGAFGLGQPSHNVAT